MQNDAISALTILSLEDVTIQRGDYPLCVGVSASLQSQDICHLIGANGTGKTTLLMQLAGLLPIQEGRVSYLGKTGLPIAPVYVSHQIGINTHLSVAQNLQFLLNLYQVEATKDALAEALAWAGLAGFETLGSNQLSAGQTRRITLARLYLMTPDHASLWLLDEPFTALDVDMVARLQQRLSQFALQGGSVLMTSHQAVTVANTQLNLSDYLPQYDVYDDDHESDMFV